MRDRENPWQGTRRPQPAPLADARSWSDFVDAVVDPMIVYDAELRYVALNRAAAEIYGYAAADLVGRSRDEVVGNDEHTPRMREALFSGKPIVVLNEVPTAGGRRAFETIYQPYRGPSGHELFLIGVAREMSTSRERRERELQRRESGDFAPLAAEVQHAANRGGVIRFDDAWRIVAWSRGAEETFGWAAPDVLGRDLGDVHLMHDDDLGTLMARLHALSDETPVTEVQGSYHKSGRAIDCLWVTSRLAGENAGGYLSLVQDVTDAEVHRKQALLNEERLRSLFENSPDGIGAVDPAGNVTQINDAALGLIGYERDEVIGRPFTAFFDEEALPPLLASFARSLAGQPERIEAQPRAKDGSHVDLEFTSSPILSDGEVVGVYVAMKDISGRKTAERALQRQHERIRELYLCATASTASSEEQVRRTLELGCRMLGMELAAIYDAQASAITVSASSNGDRQHNGATISEQLCRAAMAAPEGLALDDPQRSRHLLATGTDHPLTAFIGVPVDAAGTRFGALCFAAAGARQTPIEPADRDLVALISVLVGAEIERGRARLHLRSLAYYDALTGLPNRLLLRERLDAALVACAESGSKSAVLFLDLDRFKDVNDTHGHVLGDRLLQLAAGRIVGCVRSSETVARMGGDEFIVVMPAIRETSEAVSLAERLLRAIDAPFQIAEHEQYTTTSIGIAIAAADGADADTLIKNADIAMYRAKDRGRNTYVLFTPEFDRSMSQRVSNEQGMRRAIERGEFRTYFQPVIDLHAGRIQGVEALARWQHPALSILRPEAFIANAEENGLIVRLGEVVLEDACRQVLRWHESGLRELHLAVNLSARQFREPQLLDLIGSVLERTGFPPRLLDLEIAEAVAMADAEMSVNIMRDLKSSGVKVLVDNFGTGYSSLGYLGRFPLDGIKIDRSFTAGVGRDRDSETIVRTMIGIAHTLRLDVVAEGVETPEQVEFLRREGCERLQGHFYAPALPATGCERYLRAWSALVDEEIAAGP